MVHKTVGIVVLCVLCAAANVLCMQQPQPTRQPYSSDNPRLRAFVQARNIPPITGPGIIFATQFAARVNEQEHQKEIERQRHEAQCAAYIKQQQEEAQRQRHAAEHANRLRTQYVQRTQQAQRETEELARAQELARATVGRNSPQKRTASTAFGSTSVFAMVRSIFESRSTK